MLQENRPEHKKFNFKIHFLEIYAAAIVITVSGVHFKFERDLEYELKIYAAAIVITVSGVHFKFERDLEYELKILQYGL